MAFFSKAGNILRQTVSNQINREVSACNPSIFQAIRCMSSSKVFVGGLAWATDEHGLKEAFSKYGEVVEAKVITDHESGRSRGFGFVTYASPEDASSAIQALDGQDLHGRNVRVNFANERARGGGGGFGGGGYAGGGGGYGGGGGGYGGGGGGYGGGSGGYGGGGSNYGGGGSYGGDNNYGRSGGGYGGSGGGYGGDSLSGNGSFGSPSDNISGPPAGFSGGDQYDNSIGNINNDAGQFEETFVNDDEQPSDYEKRA